MLHNIEDKLRDPALSANGRGGEDEKLYSSGGKFHIA